MRAKTALRRRQIALNKFERAIKNGKTYRQAEALYHIPKSTAWSAFQPKKKFPNGVARRTLTDAEEKSIIELVLRCADKGVPLNSRHLSEAAHVFINTLPDERRRKLDFPTTNQVSSGYVHFTSDTKI